MEFILQTNNPDKGNIRFEVHKTGCRHTRNTKDERSFILEAENPEELIKRDIGEEHDFESYRKCYKIAPCLKTK